MTTKLLNDELTKGYNLDLWNCIKNPGKFEGEHVSILYWYDMFLNGYDTVFEVSDEERKEFEYADDVKYIYLAESNDGFCSLEFYTTREEAESRQDEEFESLGEDY